MDKKKIEKGIRLVLEAVGANLKLKDIFPDLQAFKDYIKEHLGSYRELHRSTILHQGSEKSFSEEQEKELLDALSKLFAKEKEEDNS